MKTFILSHYRRVKEFYAKYERLLMSGMLVGGFLFDFVAFVHLDIVVKFTVLLVYWVISGAAIIFMQLYDAGKIPPARHHQYARLFMPLAVQFCFGGLLNISLIFYWFSGAFSVSWPVMAITVALLIFNDSFRHFFSKPLAAISIYFFITFSLFSLILPFLFASMNAWLFVAAGAASLLTVGGGVYYLRRVAGHSKALTGQLFASIFIIAAAMNVLYFTNIIPPIPLALREAELYHSLSIKGGQYTMGAEPESFLQLAMDTAFGQTLHVTAGEKTYLYTSVFAPARLKTTIVNRWQYYDGAQKKWIDEGKSSFTISGGRQEGYKGYSWRSNLAAGKWRVYVQNQRGQVLASVPFTVVKVDKPVELQKVVR